MPEAPLEFPQLLPPLGDELTADQALSAVATQPFDPDPAGLPQLDDTRPFGMTWAWDWANGRFLRAGSSPVPVWDTNNLRQWIQAALNTARGAHSIYDDQFGMDMDVDLVNTMAFDVAAQHLYAQAVTEALMTHDRITDVVDWRFYVATNDPDQDGSSTYVDFTVQVDNGESLDLTMRVFD